MNKIRSIAQLRTEQLRLARERHNIEDNIRKDWNGLRHDFDPAALTREWLLSAAGRLGRRILSKEKPSGPLAQLGRILLKRSK